MPRAIAWKLRVTRTPPPFTPGVPGWRFNWMVAVPVSFMMFFVKTGCWPSLARKSPRRRRSGGESAGRTESAWARMPRPSPPSRINDTEIGTGHPGLHLRGREHDAGVAGRRRRSRARPRRAACPARSRAARSSEDPSPAARWLEEMSASRARWQAARRRGGRRRGGGGLPARLPAD